MAGNEIKVMIVEDDSLAVKIYEQFTHKIEGFQIVASASDGSQALELLEVFTPDLVLLDVFLPDMRGIDLLWKIRQSQLQIDVILITAANDTETVSDAIRGGAFSYMIKPIMIDKFTSTLERYKSVRAELNHRQIVDQHVVDQLFRPVHPAVPAGTALKEAVLPKGVDKLTLKLVRDRVKLISEAIGVEELAELAGMSHSTVRRYLEYMVSIGEVKVDTSYGVVGRPERKYKWSLKE
ncbi:response regulator [Paenibacillus sp. GCM10027627]|uniref:response regulator n=1 Tax=unclassified Paenibacillus TaxID=185978 RepID=UPI003635EB13